MTHYSGSGTHRGTFLGVPATQRKFTNVECIQIDQVRDGKIVHTKAIWDVANLQRQLGLAPEMARGTQETHERRPMA